MDLGKYSEAILSGKNADALKKLAEGENGRRVAGLLQEEDLLRAVQNGDGTALSTMLKSVLSTPQGRALAEEVRKAVKD